MTAIPATPKRKPGRPRVQFTVTVTMVPVPLPPEKEYEYREAWRIIGRALDRARREQQPTTDNTIQPTTQP